MKTFYRYVILLSIPIFVFAQNKGIKITAEPVKIFGAQNQYMVKPKWSPDEKYIAFTAEKHKGIWLLDIVSKKIELLTNELSAGYGFSFSSDGTEIACRVAVSENRRYNYAIKVININNKSERLISDFVSMLPGTPYWVNGDAKIILNGTNKLYLFDSQKEKTFNKGAFYQTAPFLLHDQIAISNINSKNYSVMKPVTGRYLNLTPSPDGKKIAFEIIGGDLYVINTDGTELINLGRGYRPSWSGNSQWISFMITDDDGYNYTDADIYVIRSDGKFKTNLTENFDELSFNPDWSKKSNRIIFNSADGEIFVILIELPF